MDIALSNEQQLLQDTAARLAQSIAVTSPEPIPAGAALDAQWRHVVELGVPTLRSPELCGLDASGVETAVVIEQLARTLCAVPVVGQGILAAELLQAAGCVEELERLAKGGLRAAPVLGDTLIGFAAPHQPGVAFDAAGATHALMVADVDGQRRLLCAPLGSGDDGATALDLTREFRNVAADLRNSATVTGKPIDDQRWQRVELLAITAVAADLVGVMQGALDDAVRYACERTQFSVKIGSFQAIQHLLADALVRVEGARSCLWHAAWAIDRLPFDEARLAAVAAKAYASAAGRDVVETSVQVFGGIAITWEHVSHLRLRRMLMDRRLFGDESVHYEAIAAMRLADRKLA
ncbi:acyl-CoA dehydrogenase [Mycobacterium gordonae]|uniref:Acyl-CoA dehydrogenase n=1 Tax=Mycobacterium gordonae TaxID=1778 RepID=A0A1X1XBL1_MYCGO|nr:acyl-CoA dehydrogenase [Mycobacterium gordonae]MCV7007404.1 acyl-CoA dehydrogenase [Mycobacterium gordonae]ODR23640.1 acyl-CoA dehydrogenase [Mycobacterium gordonae]ORV96321.1 acyl-CoA dehydrogenase [Mycobacterium gordonae]